jgi:PAS domain S-box-containing protein
MSEAVSVIQRRLDEIRILHVEDDPGFADLVSTCLKDEDDRFEVRSATNPNEGEAILSEADIDCIVSDYDMPHRTGIQFLEAVREDHPDLPFILYTGKGSEEVASEAISAGVTDYLQKGSGRSQFAVLANRIGNSVEQYRSQQAIRETEEKLSELANRTDDVLFMFNGDWTELLFINAAYEDIWGSSIAELQAEPRSFLEHVHPEDKEKLHSAIEESTNGDPVEREYRIVRPDGQQRWVSADAKPIVGADGTVSRIVGHVRDVTERKQGELQLETVIGNLPGYVYRHEFTSDYPLEFVKGDAESVTGYTTTELEEDVTLAEEIIHPDDRADVWETGMESIEETGRYDITYRIVTKGGEQRWIRDQGQLVEDPVTGQEYQDGFITDVTEQKEREQELERTREFFTEAERLGELGAWEFDATGRANWTDGTKRIFEVGDDFEPTVEDAIELFHPEDRARIRDAVERAITEDEPYDMEVRILTASGDERWVRTHGSVLSETTPTTVRGYIQDITDRKEREEALVTQNRRLEQFTDTISHDLRNPLNVANTRLELLADEYEGEHLEPIERAHDRMEALLEDLLAVAREGEDATDHEPVTLERIATQCWDTVETGDASLVVEQDATVQGDEGRLKQLFDNLFRNAIEHAGTDVTVTLGVLDDGFYVADDGPGLPPDEQAQVFDPGVSTTTGNTGFGLTIVDQIVRDHGWEIRATESTEGGARFEITGVDRAPDDV